MAKPSGRDRSRPLSHTRHERSYAALAWSVTGEREARRCQIRWRFAFVGWRRSGVARGRTTPSPRRPARRLHGGPPRSRSSHAQLGRYHSFSAPDDRRRLRGRQRRQLSAKRSDVQDGARSVAVRSGIVLAIDDLAARESAERSRLAAHGRWSIFIASPSKKFPDESRSTSTIRSTRCMAASSCGCSTRVMTSMAFSQSSCSTARLLRAIRTNWPNTEILLRADSHYCSPEVLDWCRANGLDYILGVAPVRSRRKEGRALRTPPRLCPS